MSQIFMHKDIPVARVNEFRQLVKIFNKIEMPIGTYNQNNILCNRLFDSWSHGRTIPNDRQNKIQIEKILKTSVDDAFLKSLGVSLTDCYWFKPEENKLTWQDVNFHDNGFSDTFAKEFLNTLKKNIDNSEYHKDVSYDIPDITTDGSLKKIWISLNGIPTLIKAGNIGSFTQGSNLLSANEIIATEIANILNINHVQYYPINIHNQIFCACPCFINSPDYDCISLLQIIHEYPKYNKYGINNLFSDLKCSKHFINTLFLDAIICNFDRHEKNIMFIRPADNKNLSDISPLPIFDSGSSLGYYRKELLKPLSLTQIEQFEYIQNKDNKYFSIDIDFNIFKKIITNNYELFQIPEELYTSAINIMNQSEEIYKTLYKQSHIYINHNHKTNDDLQL